VRGVVMTALRAPHSHAAVAADAVLEKPASRSALLAALVQVRRERAEESHGA
jgi:hypothetical protein